MLVLMGDSYSVTAAGKPGAFIMHGVRKGLLVLVPGLCRGATSELETSGRRKMPSTFLLRPREALPFLWVSGTGACHVAVPTSTIHIHSGLPLLPAIWCSLESRQDSGVQRFRLFNVNLKLSLTLLQTVLGSGDQ